MTMLPELERRKFLKTAALGAASTALGANSRNDSETLVATLYHSLTEEQKSAICLPLDHPLRGKVDANWHITPHRIGKFFTRDQQAMIREIFEKLHNPDFVDKVMQHLKDDAGGIENYSMALFGRPSGGSRKKQQFEFVLTGRHCTMRCDGDSADGVAFGGPIFYGHQAGPTFEEKADHPENVYWYQAKRANEVYQALSGKQRQAALLSVSPRQERATATVRMKSQGETFAGLPVAEMSVDQRELVEKVLADLLLPFRRRDIDEAMRYIRDSGGVSSMSMAFYKNLDLGNDGVWDVWQLEGPSMVWYFRGHPHVHTWVNLRARA